MRGDEWAWDWVCGALVLLCVLCYGCAVSRSGWGCASIHVCTQLSHLYSDSRRPSITQRFTLLSSCPLIHLPTFRICKIGTCALGLYFVLPRPLVNLFTFLCLLPPPPKDPPPVSRVLLSTYQPSVSVR